MAVLTNIPNNTSARDWRDTVNSLIKRIAALEAAGVPVETPAPAFTTQPSISPTSGTAGSTVYAATPGTVSNGAVVSRAWLLNGTAISTGVTAFPASSGTLAYQETASGPGGTTTSTVQVAAVTAATVTPTPAPSFTSQPSISPNTGTAGATTFTATAGNVSNGSVASRSWTINGTVISTGLTASPASSGTLTYQETATGPGGTTQSTVQQVTVATAAAPAPAFTTQPTVSPSTGTAGTTTYTATPGAVSNGSITSRAWALNGSTISTGLTAAPASAGTLTYQEFATGTGGSASSSVLTRTVSAATPSLTLSPASISIASNAAAGTTVSNISNVPAGVTPSVTPNDGRLVIAGDASAGWKVVRGMSAISAGTFNFSVSATGATGASGSLTVTASAALSAARMTNISAAPNAQYSTFVERTYPRSALSVVTSGGTVLTMRGTQASGLFQSVPPSLVITETHPTLGTLTTTQTLTALPAPAVAADGILTTITGTGGSSAIVSPMTALTVPAFASGTPDGEVITIDSSVGYQSIIGFGAALTDSALQRLTVAMTASQRAAFLQEAFGTNGFSSIRVPIGPNDFQRSTDFPTCNDTPGDFAMANFNLAVEQASGLIDVLREIVAINPNIGINGAVWSLPAWMKNNNSVTGEIGDNTLKTDAQTRNAAALYFAKWVQAIEAAVGVTGIVKSVTVQNEPYNDIAGRPSMLMTTADSIDFVGNYMGPVFEANGITARILIGSVSWGSASGGGSGGYINGALQDANAGKYLEGSAWHAYSGNPATQNTSYNANPTKSSHFVEMRTLLAQSTDNTSSLSDSSLGIIMGNVFMGSLRGGASRVMLWNLALSPSGTPTQGSTGRRGVVKISDAGVVDRSVEYYIIAHFAKYVKRGARRIDSTSPGGIGISVTDLVTVAFQNPDGTIVAVIWNPKLTDQATSVVDATSGKFTTVTIPARSFATLRYSGLVASAQTPAPAPAPATRSTPTLDANPAPVSQAAYASGITQAITIASGATLLTVSLMAIRTSDGSGNRTVASAVSVNGVALTQLELLDSSGNVTQNRHAEVWYMVNPPSGAQIISVDYPKPATANTSSGNLLISSQSWKGTSVTAGDIFSDRVNARSTDSAGVTNLTAKTAVTGVQLAVSAIRSTTLPTVSSAATVLANQLTGTNMAGTVTMKTGTDLTATRDWTTADQGVLIAFAIKGALK